MAATIARKIVPILDGKQDVKLVCIGIGTKERAKEFSELVGFPEHYLYSDPENQVYEKLGLIKSASETFFNPKTPLAIGRRFQEGNEQDFLNALKNWKPWIPPKLGQGFQQGGAFVFSGRETVYGRKDPATGDHADLNVLLNIILQETDTKAR